VVESGGKINYIFEEVNKNPTEVKNISLKQIERIAKAVNIAQGKAKSIMDRFRESIKQWFKLNDY